MKMLPSSHLRKNQRGPKGAASLAEFAPTLIVLICLIFPLVNMLGVACGLACATVVTWQSVRQASVAYKYQDALDAMVLESRRILNGPFGKFAKLQPVGGYRGCGCDLYIKVTGTYNDAKYIFGPNTGPVYGDAANYFYEVSTKAKYEVGPLIPMHFVAPIADVPGLGKPWTATIAWDRAVENKSMLESDQGRLTADGEGSSGHSVDFCPNTPGNWYHPDVYTSIEGAGQNVVRQDVVQVEANHANWLRTGVMVGPSDKLWIDTRTDNRWTHDSGNPRFTAEGEGAASGPNGLPLGRLLGKVGSRVFAIGKEQLNFPSPASGELLLLMNDSGLDASGVVQDPLAWSENRGVVSARIISAQ